MARRWPSVISLFSSRPPRKAARRKTRVLDKPAFGLAGWKFAAPQTVIVSDRRLPGAERSKSAKTTLQPSACLPRYIAHPGVGLLLKTKAQPQFDRTVTDRSKLLFCPFHHFNLLQFHPVFLVLTVRSAEGRRGYSFTQSPNHPFTQFC